ncbi:MULTISPECIES: ABC transporter ATP-binding protein [Oerskovia]|uniref:Lipoprotein-releasing system ATP-binding protein LolD n=1 Tax=Oerskovia enterophila TaxID=43678 RepID=A0A161XHZ5_9CELL|nr:MULTISPECIES: ABC transporter ATP-binding protein [Oerskovia]KRC31730.1 ABC transporter ATP-binding protein [Oerskovia sp. Root22]KRD35294.1 ABC transporter ATP-binding protein [Oerskovia sp. Root918]KZM36437.1 lipoprotein-releasing system ATP-binding protein LolD [Oerskovia enterophila]OCI29576.1 lipoprotein-releasing system ATP-binding protein LolD [Oerskovia enterophila]
MTHPTQQVSSTSTATRAGLEIDGVTLTLGDGDSTVTALDHVHLTVAPGELLAVLGPSGAGKSSLLAVAGALTRPTSGSVRIDGTDVSAMPSAGQAALRRERIGFVFQSGNLLPALTALDQLRFALHVSGGKNRGRDPLTLLEQVGMGHKADRRPHELSGGERQRVGIARALVTAPALLLVDEPTAALDRARSHEVVRLLAAETHDHGVATVMVTHDHDVLEHCDRVVHMEDGRLSA